MCALRIFIVTNFKEKTVSNEYTTKRSFESYNILISQKLEEDDIGWWHTVSLPNSYRDRDNYHEKLDHNKFSSMDMKPINIHWIRTGSQPY